MGTCREVMTKNPVYCLPGDRAAKVAQLMKSTDIGAVPIVEDDESKRLVGIVTDRDLAVKMVDQYGIPLSLYRDRHGTFQRNDQHLDVGRAVEW